MIKLMPNWMMFGSLFLMVPLPAMTIVLETLARRVALARRAAPVMMKAMNLEMTYPHCRC